MKNKTYEGWVSILTTGLDYEADLVRHRLDDAGIPAVVLTQRDHAFNLTVGDLSPVYVMVQPERQKEAMALLQSQPFTDEELSGAAMMANPDAPDAHTLSEQSMLDSGIDEIRFTGAIEDEEEETT